MFLWQLLVSFVLVKAKSHLFGLYLQTFCKRPGPKTMSASRFVTSSCMAGTARADIEGESDAGVAQAGAEHLDIHPNAGKELATCSDDVMREVDQAIRVSLDLPDGV